jgi:tetratricopeptide (TPR) repeat protein
MNFLDTMTMRQIDGEIKKAVALKRSGKLTEARVALERCLDSHERSNPAILAPIYKSLGKVLYLQGDFQAAQLNYIEAIRRYRALNSDEQSVETMVHLGACDSSFLNSQLLSAYVRGLRGEDTWAKVATVEVVNNLLSLGEALFTGGPQKNTSANAASLYNGQSRETSMNSTCLDMLRLFRELLVRTETDDPEDFADAIARYLLVQFGFGVQAVDEANNWFFMQVESARIEDLGSVIRRVADIVQDNDWQKEWFVSAMAAIVQVQQEATITEAQRDYISAFKDLFDMKPSKFEGALQRGFDWGVALAFAAEAYCARRSPS